AVRVYDARDERGARIDDPLRFLNDPGSIIVTREFATRHALRAGDALELETPGGRRRFTVRAFLDPYGIARVHGGNLAVMDLFAAEESFTRPGLINRVDVVVGPAASIDAVQTAITRVLPEALRVERPAQRKADLHQVIASMQLILTAVAMLALAAAWL